MVVFLCVKLPLFSQTQNQHQRLSTDTMNSSSKTAANIADPSQKSLTDLYPRDQYKEEVPFEAKENNANGGNVHGNTAVAAKQRWICDFCGEDSPMFDSFDEALAHENQCENRKQPAALKSSNTPVTTNAASPAATTEKSTPKKRKINPSARKKGKPLSVQISSKGKRSTTRVTISGVCTDAMDSVKSEIQLEQEHHEKDVITIKNFLSGFGMFIW